MSDFKVECTKFAARLFPQDAETPLWSLERSLDLLYLSGLLLTEGSGRKWEEGKEK